ncbi:MAG: hypothetical protein ACE5EF_05505 [Dehalococcoidia bacterium]
MRALVGPLVAFVLFAAAFALHVIAGAADLGWLFAFAVILIFASAAGFPVVARLAGRPRDRRERVIVLSTGTLVGAVLMAGTLWAANDRSWAAWTLPAAGLVALVAMFVAARIPSA